MHDAHASAAVYSVDSLRNSSDNIIRWYCAHAVVIQFHHMAAALVLTGQLLSGAHLSCVDHNCQHFILRQHTALQEQSRQEEPAGSVQQQAPDHRLVWKKLAPSTNLYIKGAARWT